MMFHLKAVITLCLISSIEGLYENFQVFHTHPLESLHHVSIIKDILELHSTDTQIIQDQVVRKHNVDLVVTSSLTEEIKDILVFSGIKYDVLTTNLARTIEESNKINNEARNVYNRRRKYGSPSQLDHTFYRRHSEINEFLADRARNHGSFTSLFSIGNSFEGRSTQGIEVTGAGSTFPYIWIDAGMHAREWIAPATALYIIDQILNGTDVDSQYLRNNYNFLIVPSANPDGYEFCHTTDRMWRKNRRPPGGSSCVGIDNNRNFDYKWGGIGTSTDPCSFNFGGPHVFSEVESRNLRDAVLANSQETILYLNLHSFAQYWLVPWSGEDNKPADYEDLIRVGNAAADAIANTEGRQFIVGTAPDIMYPFAGGTSDWAKDKAGIKYSFTPELRPADDPPEGGFIIPPSNIIPSGREIMAGLTAAAVEIAAIENKKKVKNTENNL